MSVLSETRLTFEQARKHQVILDLNGGKPVCRETLKNWHRRGAGPDNRRVYLEAARLPRAAEWFTSVEAIERFAEAYGRCDQEGPIIWTTPQTSEEKPQRLMTPEQTDDFLRKEGLL
jgi:hypothetical protein